jgi:ring-1,2-phenylacetyl-CoA epoxidase subunit PaaD
VVSSASVGVDTTGVEDRTREIRARDIRAREICAGVPDPELPVVTLGDLGIVRDVRVADDGHVEVLVTPTYSGCPATEVIRADLLAALRAGGFDDAAVLTVRAPAWTTDWITDAGRRKLADNGIAPPSGLVEGRTVRLELSVPCPQCGSRDTALVSRFGPTACLAMYRCRTCLEPFDHVKPY